MRAACPIRLTHCQIQSTTFGSRARLICITKNAKTHSYRDNFSSNISVNYVTIHGDLEQVSIEENSAAVSTRQRSKVSAKFSGRGRSKTGNIEP